MKFWCKGVWDTFQTPSFLYIVILQRTKDAVLAGFRRQHLFYCLLFCLACLARNLSAITSLRSRKVCLCNK